MYNFEVFWPGFWCVQALLFGYGLLLGAQMPERWIRILSLIGAPILSAAVIDIVLVEVAKPNEWSAAAQLWGFSVAMFLLAFKMGYWFWGEEPETLDELRLSNKDGRRF